MEQTFRTMKSDLGLRPIYHRKTLRMEAHLFLCILAFHTAHLIRSKLRAHPFQYALSTLFAKHSETRKDESETGGLLFIICTDTKHLESVHQSERFFTNFYFWFYHHLYGID